MGLQRDPGHKISILILVVPGSLHPISWVANDFS